MEGLGFPKPIERETKMEPREQYQAHQDERLVENLDARNGQTMVDALSWTRTVLRWKAGTEEAKGNAAEARALRKAAKHLKKAGKWINGELIG